MLDISFYTKNGQPPYTVEVAEDIYEWLLKSDFSKIGKSVSRKIKVKAEEEKIPLVQLGKDNRKKLRAFFFEAITQESDAVLTKLGDCPSKKEYQDATYRLRKLQRHFRALAVRSQMYPTRAAGATGLLDVRHYREPRSPEHFSPSVPAVRVTATNSKPYFPVSVESVPLDETPALHQLP